MSCLLDGNVLIAISLRQHVHHEAADGWLQQWPGSIATCPITQGTLIRQLLRSGLDIAGARSVLADFNADPRHEFWADDLSYLDVSLVGVVGHRQVTDAYLAGLARAHGGSLATFDRGLAGLHPDVAELVPT